MCQDPMMIIVKGSERVIGWEAQHAGHECGNRLLSSEEQASGAIRSSPCNPFQDPGRVGEKASVTPVEKR